MKLIVVPLSKKIEEKEKLFVVEVLEEITLNFYEWN